jgi:hypothetical protein
MEKDTRTSLPLFHSMAASDVPFLAGTLGLIISSLFVLNVERTRSPESVWKNTLPLATAASGASEGIGILAGALLALGAEPLLVLLFLC